MLLTFSTAHAQDTVAYWSFPTGTALDSIADFAINMNMNVAIHARGGVSAINFSTNGNPSYCAQATNWDAGTGIKYWSVTFYTTGYQNLALSSQIRAGNTNAGPRDWKLQYRILPATGWTDIPNGNIAAGNNWTTGATSNLPLPAAMNDLGNLAEIRWVMRSDTAITGSLVQATGISKIDNILIKGSIVTNTKDITSGNAISIFPNPSAGIVNLRLNENYERMEVYTSTGQKIVEKSLEGTRSQIQTDLSAFPRSMYLIRLVNQREIQTWKLLLK